MAIHLFRRVAMKLITKSFFSFLFSCLIANVIIPNFSYAESNVAKDITGYNFPNKLLFSDVQKYRTIMHTIWKMPMRARNSAGILEDPACIVALAKNSFSDTRLAGYGEKGCLGGLEWAIHSALFDDERMDLNRFRNFFEDIIPQIINNQSYLDGPRNDIHYFRAMQSLYMGYALYGDIYGVSDELDAAMGKHFEKFVKRLYGSKQDRKNTKRCKNFPETKEKYMRMRYDSIQGCSDGSAMEWVKLYTAMGIVTKRADFLDEALRRLDSFLSSTFENGVPLYALRAGDAPGYLAQNMEHMDDVGFMFEHYLGYDIWNYRAGGHWNNSFGDILSYSIRAFMDPSINIEYARVNDILKGKDHYECCAGDENWKSAPGRNNDPIEIQKTINSYLLGTSWALLKLGNKDLLNRIEPDRPNVVWRSMNTFPNKIVMLQSSNSKNELTILTREIDQKEMESLMEKLGETDSNKDVNDSSQDNDKPFDFSQYDFLQENLRCNFQIERELLNNGERNKIAEGELEVLRGNVIFLRENWNTGSGDNQLLSKQSNLKIASDGRLLGSTPVYIAFGNNDQKTTNFYNRFRKDKSDKLPNGVNESMAGENHQIFFQIDQCVNLNPSEKSDVNDSSQDNDKPFDFSQYDFLQENLRCNFQIERELLNNGERNKIAEGELEVLRGNVIFLRENWNTGSGDNQLLSKQSNLKIASDGRLIGKTPLYTMFGNNQIHTALFEKNFETRNQNLNAEGININIIENHIKIILELNNCK